MNSSQHFHISSRPQRKSKAIIIPDSSNTWLGLAASEVLNKSYLLLFTLLATGLGAVLNQLLGIGAALVVTLIVLPTFAAIITLSHLSKKKSPEALSTALSVGLISPLLALPGAVLGIAALTALALVAGCFCLAASRRPAFA